MIGRILVENGFISDKQLTHALDEHRKEPGEQLETILIRLGYVTSRDVAHAYAEQAATYHRRPDDTRHSVFCPYKHGDTCRAPSVNAREFRIRLIVAIAFTTTLLLLAIAIWGAIHLAGARAQRRNNSSRVRVQPTVYQLRQRSGFQASASPVFATR